MPELPEVETTCRGIEPHCINQTIVTLLVRQAKLRWPVSKTIATSIEGKTVDAVSRRGKYILLSIGGGELMIHLGMSGSLRVVSEQTELKKHDHFELQLSNGKIIRFNDPRRFGSLFYNPPNELHPLLAKLGVEPLTTEFDADYLHAKCRNRKVPIKSLIMNNQVVVGVGNIYAQEALFMAKINPLRQASQISKKRLASLVKAIKQVLALAIKAGGSSLKDFTAADGKPGYFQHTFQVYGRAEEPCKVCESPLKHTTLGQRTTTYCSRCQR